MIQNKSITHTHTFFAGEYKLKGTAKTPAIYFDLNEGVLEIAGRSILENPLEFYKPLLQTLNEYTSSPRAITTVNIHLEYFNTSSSQSILEIFRRLEKIHKIQSLVTINWVYDEEDSLGDGQVYKAIINIPFNLLKETN